MDYLWIVQPGDWDFNLDLLPGVVANFLLELGKGPRIGPIGTLGNSKEYRYGFGKTLSFLFYLSEFLPHSF